MHSIRDKLYPALPFLVPWFSFFILDVFVSQTTGAAGPCSLIFSAIWSAIFAAVLSLLPRFAARIVFLIVYYPAAAYAIIQSGYYQIFDKFMWLKDITYLRDGAEFAGSLFDYLSAGFIIGCIAVLIWGIIACILLPKHKFHLPKLILTFCFIITAICSTYYLVNLACSNDEHEYGLGTDFFAGKSLRRAYDLMYDAKKVYSLCGLYHTAGRDFIIHVIMPQLPGSQSQKITALAEIESYFDQRQQHSDNEMTGKLAGKNVILVLMESADDWAIREDVTPTICRLMREGINFTNMYTPLYGSARTFNTEFAMNTGIFAPTNGNLTFTYCNNDFRESLPHIFRKAGYSANAFHYNVGTFYSRNIMDPAMGYENYISYADYTEYGNQFSSELRDDTYVLDNAELNRKLLCEQPFFNFVISRNAHLAYSKNDSVARHAIEKYPQFEGIDQCDEIGYYYAKMHLLDDFFAELLQQLQEKNLLNNTVIIGVTDHYAYSIKDQQRVLQLSNVPSQLMVEKTPFFIWSADIQPMVIDKTLNTSDIAPTLFNLFGMDTSEYNYIGQDAFDPNYSGYAIFSDGSWIDGNAVYQNGQVVYEFYSGAASQTDITKMNAIAEDFIQTSNLILETDYYKQKE